MDVSMLALVFLVLLSATANPALGARRVHSADAGPASWAKLFGTADNITVNSATLFDLFVQQKMSLTEDPLTVESLPSWVKVGKVKAEVVVEEGERVLATLAFPVRVLRSPGDTTSQTSEIDLISTKYTLLDQNISVTQGECMPELYASPRHYVLLIPGAKGSCMVQVKLEVVVTLTKQPSRGQSVQNIVKVPLPLRNFGSEIHATLPHTVGSKAQRPVWSVSASTIKRSVAIDDVKNVTHATFVTGAHTGTVTLEWFSSTVLGLSRKSEPEPEDVDEEAEDDVVIEKPRPLEFSSTHFVQSTIATGYVSTTETFQYEVTSGELPEVSLHVPKNVRVGDVFGDVDSWNIRNDTSDPSQQVLFVRRSNPSSPTMYIGVRTEMDIDATHSKFKFEPLRTIGPRREQGYVSFSRASSLDVKVANLNRIARIDSSETPHEIASSASQRGKHLIGVFKFSHAQFSLEVEVIRHSDVPIVTCVAEQAEFELLTSPQGTVINSRILVANMDMDWLHVHLQHKNYDLWSVHVDGEPVKSVSDSPGHILVPLNRRTDASTEGVKQQVEITHFSQEIAVNASLGDHQISAILPTLEVPILEVFASISVPATEKYINYEDESETLSNSQCYSDRARRIKDTNSRHAKARKNKKTQDRYVLRDGCGSRGPQGPQGPQGLQGPTGLQGPQGPIGERGPTGTRGPRGHVAPAGGQLGKVGPLPGPHGQKGHKGSMGVAGPEGLRGLADKMKRHAQPAFAPEYGAYVENGTLPVKIEIRRAKTQFYEFCVSAALTMPKEQGEEIVLSYTTVNTRDWQYKAKIFLERHGRDVAMISLYIIALMVAIMVLKAITAQITAWVNQLAVRGEKKDAKSNDATPSDATPISS